MRPILPFFALIVICIALPACSNVVNGKDLADKQVPIFHQLFNEQKYQEIISGADPDMLKASPEAKIIELLQAVNRKLGSVKQSNTINWNVNSFNLETRVVLVQNTTFEKGSGTETFTYRISDGKARLLGYFINSTDLIVN